MFPAENGQNLTSLNASNLASGTVASALVSGVYSSITGLGTLSGLTVSGTSSLTGATTLTANAAATIPLSIVGAASQSGDYLDITANGGAAGGVFKIASTGNITATGTLTGLTGLNMTSGTATLRTLSATTSTLGNTTYTNTSGTQENVSVTSIFAPTAASSATFVGEAVTPTVNFQAGGTGASTALLVNPTYTAVGTGAQLLLDLQNNSASKFSVSNTGNISATGTISSGNVNGQTISGTANFTGTESVASTLTASNGLTLTTGALNLTGTSGLIALTGFGTTSITSNSAGSDALTVTDNSLNGASNSDAVFGFTNASTTGSTEEGVTINASTAANASDTTNLLRLTSASATGTVNGIYIGSTNFTNFIKTPTFVLSSGGAVSGLTGLTVASGGESITGNSTVTGTLSSLTGLTSSGTITFSGLSNGVAHVASGVLSGGAISNSDLTSGAYGAITGLGTLTALTVIGRSDLTGATTLTANAAATIPLSIVGAASQSGDYLDVTANGGSAGGVFKITSAGVATGNGSGLTTLNASNLASGTVPTAAFPGGAFNGNSELVQTTAGGALPALSATNLTSIPAGNLTGSYAALNGSAITTLNASNLASGTVASALVSGAYNNITGLGTLGSLTVSGVLTTSATGKTAITISDSGAQNSGLTIGGDTNLYRGGAGLLQTDTTFQAGAKVIAMLGQPGQVNVGNQTGTAIVTFGSAQDTNLYRAASGQLQTDGSLGLGIAPANGKLQLASATTASGGIYFGTDTNLYRSSAGNLKTDGNLYVGNNLYAPGLVSNSAGAGSNLLSLAATTDANFRFQVDTSGTITWGPGTSGIDTNLRRDGPALLATDGGIWADPSTTSSLAFRASVPTDSVNRWQVAADGQMQWGEGGTSAVDTNLYRGGVGLLQTDTTFQAGAKVIAMLGQPGQVNVGNQTGTAIITFGSAQDTNLYRAAAGALQTDGSLTVGGNITGNSNLNLGTGTLTSGAITSSGALSLGTNTITSAAINGQTISSAANLTGSLAVGTLFTLNDATTAGGERGLQIGASSDYPGFMQNGTGGYPFFMASNAYKDSDTSSYKWGTTHASFGSRIVELQWGSNGGINFYADSAATTANTTFTPTLRMTIGNNGEVGVGATPANGLLTVGTNTTAASGGLYFGTDTNLYRGGASTVASNGSDPSFWLVAGADSANYLSIQHSPSTTAEVLDSRYGYKFSFRNAGSEAVAVGTVGPSSQAGLTLGSSADTNLYRSAVGTLKTDSNFTVAGTTTLSGAITADGVVDVVTGSAGGTVDLDLWSARQGNQGGLWLVEAKYNGITICTAMVGAGLYTSDGLTRVGSVMASASLSSTACGFSIVNNTSSTAVFRTIWDPGGSPAFTVYARRDSPTS